MLYSCIHYGNSRRQRVMLLFSSRKILLPQCVDLRVHLAMIGLLV